MMIFMHAAHVISFCSWHMVSSSNWPLQSPGKATAVISSRATMAALPASPRNGLCHRCALKFESHNCCTPPWSQSDFQRTSVGMKKTRCAVLLGILSCPLGFSAFRLFLRSLQPILAAAQAFGLDLIQRILQRIHQRKICVSSKYQSYQPPWNSFERLESWRISIENSATLCSSPGFKCGALIFIIGKASMATLQRRVSGLHMILREVPQLIWTMAHCQGLYFFCNGRTNRNQTFCNWSLLC